MEWQLKIPQATIINIKGVVIKVILNFSRSNERLTQMTHSITRGRWIRCGCLDYYLSRLGEFGSCEATASIVTLTAPSVYKKFPLVDLLPLIRQHINPPPSLVPTLHSTSTIILLDYSILRSFV